jgi:ABC-type amino acid transport substrate-binding protein
MQFVLRDPQHPVKIVEQEINVCVDMLINGTVQAVFTDQPVLQWMVANYQIVSGYVSPLLGPNPFSFVYASGSLLRQYTNPSIIAAQTNPAYIPLASALNAKYFSTGADATSAQPVCVAAPRKGFLASGTHAARRRFSGRK